MSDYKRSQALIHYVEAYAEFGIQCAYYKFNAPIKYEAEKAEENGAGLDDAVEFPNKKREVEGGVVKSGINYEHNGWYSD